jgi:uncharacterized protein (TIRG00374 family)
MRIPWRGAIGLALTVFLLWYAFRGIPWADVRANIGSVNPWLMALSVVLASMVFPLRAIRWRPILDPVSPKLPYGPLWRATAIGFMANNVMPTGRIGEFLRPLALSRETPVPFTAGFASLLVDRVFDVVAVVGLTLLALLDPRFPTTASPAMLVSSTVVGMSGLAVGLYAMVFFPDKLVALFSAVARRTVPRFEARGVTLLRTFAAGLSVLRDPKRFAVVLFWALALWFTQAVAFWIAFIAVGIDVPFSAALFVQGLIVVAVAVPGVAPAFFGAFEAAAILGLGFYGVDRTMAVTWSLVFHVLSLIPITVVGIYYLARSGMKLGDLRQIKN